jgi:hypothetical protein
LLELVLRLQLARKCCLRGPRLGNLNLRSPWLDGSGSRPNPGSWRVVDDDLVALEESLIIPDNLQKPTGRTTRNIAARLPSFDCLLGYAEDISENRL